MKSISAYQYLFYEALLSLYGSIVYLFRLKKPLHVEDVIPDFLMKSLTLHTIHGRRIFHTWEKCEQILASKA